MIRSFAFLLFFIFALKTISLVRITKDECENIGRHYVITLEIIPLHTCLTSFPSLAFFHSCAYDVARRMLNAFNHRRDEKEKTVVEHDAIDNNRLRFIYHQLRLEMSNVSTGITRGLSF